MSRRRIGVLAGAFNPVTRAHVALLEAARPVVDETVCVVPRTYPHKQFHGASLEDRIAMLRLAAPDTRVEVTESGLFIDIARELRRAQPEREVYFICGRDAAERIVTWDYGEPCAIERMLQEFQLLVAARHGDYSPPEHLRDRVHRLEIGSSFDEVCSTAVRERIAAGEPWEHLVPESTVEIVRGIYVIKKDSTD